MKLIIGWDAAVARWVGDQLGVDDFGGCRAVGITDKDELVGGVVYSNHRSPNLEMTIATVTPRWCGHRGILRDLFSIPFDQFGCGRVTAVTEDANAPARGFLRRLGFVEEGVMRRGFRTGRDAVIHGMLKSECRWIEA